MRLELYRTGGPGYIGECAEGSECFATKGGGAHAIYNRIILDYLACPPAPGSVLVGFTGEGREEGEWATPRPVQPVAYVLEREKDRSAVVIVAVDFLQTCGERPALIEQFGGARFLLLLRGLFPDGFHVLPQVARYFLSEGDVSPSTSCSFAIAGA